MKQPTRLRTGDSANAARQPQWRQWQKCGLLSRRRAGELGVRPAVRAEGEGTPVVAHAPDGKDSPGTVSPLNFISTTWVSSSWGTKEARNRWLPRVRTELVTWPPLTRISRLPDPAPEPSTGNENRGLELSRAYRRRPCRGNKTPGDDKLTLELDGLAEDSVRDAADLDGARVVGVRAVRGAADLLATHVDVHDVLADLGGGEVRLYQLPPRPAGQADGDGAAGRRWNTRQADPQHIGRQSGKTSTEGSQLEH